MKRSIFILTLGTWCVYGLICLDKNVAFLGGQEDASALGSHMKLLALSDQ